MACHPPRFRPRVFPLAGLPHALDVPRLLGAWRALPGLVALDSAGGVPAAWSLVAFEPIADDAALQDLEQVRRAVRGMAVEGEARLGELGPCPFQGGFLGAFSYDLGVEGEELDLPRDPWGTPRVVGGLYTDFALIDHGSGQAWLVLGEDPGDGRAPLAPVATSSASRPPRRRRSRG